jgi:hypothetical protein
MRRFLNVGTCARVIAFAGLAWCTSSGKASGQELPPEISSIVERATRTCEADGFEFSDCRAAVDALRTIYATYSSVSALVEALAKSSWNVGFLGDSLDAQTRITYVNAARGYWSDYLKISPTASYGYLQAGARSASSQDEEGYLRQCIDAATDPAECHRVLGDVLWEKDDKQNAVPEYRKYAEDPVVVGLESARNTAGIASKLLNADLLADSAFLYAAALTEMQDEPLPQRCTEVRTWRLERLTSFKTLSFRVNEALANCQ